MALSLRLCLLQYPPHLTSYPLPYPSCPSPLTPPSDPSPGPPSSFPPNTNSPVSTIIFHPWPRPPLRRQTQVFNRCSRNILRDCVLAAGGVILRLLQTRLRHRILHRGINPSFVPSLPRLPPCQPAGHPVVESAQHHFMRGVRTHVYYLYSMTCFTTAKYICLNVRTSAPSLLNIQFRRTHFCLARRRLHTTTAQSSSSATSTRPRYLN